MKRLYTAICWLIVVGLVGVFSLSVGIIPVQAGVGCANIIPITDGADNNLNVHAELFGDQLVWTRQTGEMYHYHLATNTTTELTWVTGFPQIEGDQMVWIGPDQQVQLYTFSTGVTRQITSDARYRVSVLIEGDYILWLQGKKPDKLNKLFMYNIATGTTTKIAKTLVYSLNEGRVLWSGNLYDLATGATTFLGADHYTLLEGDHALGMYYTPAPNAPGEVAPQLGLKNLTTGVVTQITDTYFRTRIYSFAMQGDYLSWTEQHGLNYDHTVHLYQISTGEKWDPVPYGDSAYTEEIKIDGRFLGFLAWLSSEDPYESGPGFAVYDIFSRSYSTMLYSPDKYSYFGDIDGGNIAWIEYHYDEDDGVSGMQVILGTDCGGKPTITSQTPSLNILTGRSVDLNVTVVGDQPMTYQWYQGEVGDTTTPLSESLSFTTPPLTETTSYWFQATNHFGTAETETITLTPGSSAELVVNNSFEEEDGAFFADWNGYDLYQDCDEAAHSGNCAARVDEYAAPGKLTQQLAVEFPYLTGDTLTLSAWIKANQIAFADAAVLLKVRYADDTKAKLVLKPTQTQFDYTQLTSEPITITGTISKAKVIIKYQNEDGDWWLDDVSLLHQPTSAAAIPLPPSGLTGNK